MKIILLDENLHQFNLGLIVLITFDNRYKTLKEKVPIIEELLLSDDVLSEKIIKIDLRDKWN